MKTARALRTLSVAVLALTLLCPITSIAQNTRLSVRPIGTYSAGVFDRGAAEIVAHDPATQRLFVVNGASASIDVLDVRNPATPTFLFAISLAPYGRAANSVAVRQGLVAVAVESNPAQEPGRAVFFDANGTFLNSVVIGALPDMLTFTLDGTRVLVANEGEPNTDYTVDPEGSVSIIDLRRGVAALTQADVTTARFTAFDSVMLDPSIRIFGPRASVSQDLEPEYIAVSPDSRTAWVTLQENNAIATLDVERGTITRLTGLGFKDHNLPQNAFDASDRDGGINIAPWPVFGMYQPDAIAAFQFGGETFLITANEGDARDYRAFAEERRVSALTLDPIAFPNAAFLRTDARLGRLTVTSATGDTDSDGDYDALYVFGARSFSIWNSSVAQIYDSGSEFEEITAKYLPSFFNSNNDNNNSFDTRSDNKGPEPEGVVIGEVDNRTYAFIGLERIGGIMVYDISNPSNPQFVQYVNNRNFAGDPQAGTAGDLGPEGLTFIPSSQSPTQQPLLVVANEVSGTTTVYSISLLSRERS